MAESLASAGYVVHVIEWDRTGLKPRSEIQKGVNFKRLKLKSSYGSRSACFIPGWVLFALLQLIVGDYQIVQPQNLDCLIPAFLARKFSKRAKIVYDLADFYSDAYLTGLPIVTRMCAILEKLLVRHVDALLLVSERQTLQVGTSNLPKKTGLFYNVPNVGLACSSRSNDDQREFRVFYGGTLGYDRVRLLLNALAAVKDLPTKIEVAGFGEYENFMRCLSETNSQLSFLGRLSHERVIDFTTESDLILLPYDPRYINNRIGLPNKFFEAIACGSLVLASMGTYVGEIVEKEKIGIVADYDNILELRHVIESIMKGDRTMLQLLREGARAFYLRNFDSRKLETKYLRMIRSLASE